MKLKKVLSIIALGFVSFSAHATTIWEPTDGDINFTITTGILSGYTLAIFDDESALDAGSANRLEVTVPELIFVDTAITTLHNDDFSETLSITNNNFVLGVSNDGTNWIGGDAFDPGGVLGTLLYIPEANQYTVEFGSISGLQVVVDVAPIPVPAAVWLFGSGLIGLIVVGRRNLG